MIPATVNAANFRSDLGTMTVSTVRSSRPTGQMTTGREAGVGISTGTIRRYFEDSLTILRRYFGRTSGVHLCDTVSLVQRQQYTGDSWQPVALETKQTAASADERGL